MKICSICRIEKPLYEFYSYEKETKKKGKALYYFPYCKKCSKNKTTKWIKNNPEKFKMHQRKENQKEYKKKAIRENSKIYSANGYFLKWQRENKDKVKHYRLFREQHKAHDISEEEWKACKDYFSNSCAYCGMTENEHLIEYSQVLHKDHVDHEGSNDISNCVPACKSCNSSKHTSELENWYNNENPKYSKERLESIYEWLKIVKN